MSARKALAVVLLPLLAVLGFVVPASAVGEISLTATVTNSDGIPQNGSVCLELVGSGSCSGNSLTGGAWSQTWNPATQTAGDYLFRVSASTMDGASRWYKLGDPTGVTAEADATPVHLASGEPDFHFDMVMPALATVTGFVKDNHGDPRPGMTVFRNQSGHVRSAVTDADGKYDFGYVRAGDHTLGVSASGDYSGTNGSMTVPASGVYVAPLLTVQHEAAISGTVADAGTSAQVPLVHVEVFTAGTHLYQGSAYTDLSGHYRVPGLGNQPLVARFSDEFGGYESRLYVGGNPSTFEGETSFTLASEEERTVDLTLTSKPLDPAPAHNLSGQVTGPGGVPLPGIDVFGGDGLSDQTDRDGRWYLNAPSGSHVLHFNAASHWVWEVFGSGPGLFPEYYPDSSTAGGSTPVVVDGGPAQENLDVGLTRGAFIRGAVLDAADSGTGFVPSWQAYGPGGSVDVEQDFSGGPGYSAFVRPGTWRLVVQAQRNVSGQPQAHYLPRWYGGVDSFGAATPVTVAPGDTVTGKDVHLTSTVLSNVSVPVVSGTRAVGRTLTASTGTWSTMTLTSFSIAWWRGATQVGSGSSYVVRPYDAGQPLRAEVAAGNGQVYAKSAFSTWSTIPKLASVIGLRGSSPSARKARLVITLRASGLPPWGTAVIRRGGKVVKRVPVIAGRAVVVLTRQPKGVQRYTVSYGGSTRLLPDSSPVVRIRIR